MKIKIHENFNLRHYNTFHIEARCRYFAKFQSEQQLTELLELPHIREKFMILGGGSNLLFCSDYDGAILKNAIEGFDVRLDKTDVYVTFGAGNNWHDSVTKCVRHGYCGIENLALIPGTVGAAPVQNIGAYGVELQNILYSLRGYHLDQKQFIELENSQCNFGYRDSIFKRELKGRFIITSVRLKLSSLSLINISYGALQEYFESKNVEKISKKISVKDVYKAVCKIRQSKLPDPKKIGNAGSFFKNPLISLEHYRRLQKSYATIPAYRVDDLTVKIPAAYLIETAGYKGFTVKENDQQYGVHQNQPLVLVNKKNARGESIYQLAKEIRQKIKQLFDVDLEFEVNIIR